MIGITLKTTWAHRRRLIGTFLAVSLGVAFLSGTLVLTDAMRSGFAGLFTDVYRGTDAVVRGVDELGSDAVAQRRLFDEAVVDDVAAVQGVAVAEPYLEGTGQIVGADGVSIGGDGPPTIAASWIDDGGLNPYGIVEGRAPELAGEVVIDGASAAAGGLAVGDTVVIRMPTAVEARIVGLAEPDGGSDLGGVTFAGFTLGVAQEHLAGGDDLISRVVVAATTGVSQDDLVSRIAPVVPAGIEVVSGAEMSAEATEQISADFLDFFEAFLLVFAGIALLVAGFSIYNTFSITLAQRSRESALLRAIGSSRRQVLAAAMLEATAVGVVASAVGLGIGMGLAVVLTEVLGATGFDLPTAPFTIEPGTALLSIGVGLGVTVVAATVPALRASRVPPLAALRHVAYDQSRISPVRTLAGAIVVVAGVALVVAVGRSDDAIAFAAVGALLAVAGVVALGPVIAGAGSHLIGRLLPGVTGTLARRNAGRNPRRTAGTSAALMIGVTVVALFTVVTASISATIDEAVTGSLDADLVVTAGGFSGSGLSPELADALADLDEVDRAVGIGLGAARIDGAETVFSTADAGALAEVVDLETVAGSMADVRGSGIAVAESTATAAGFELGSPITLRFVDGSTVTLGVAAVYASSAGDSLGTYIVPHEIWSEHSVIQVDNRVLVDLTDGVSVEDGRAAVQSVTAGFGSPDVLDTDQYAEALAGDVDQVLALIYALLALAIVIALMGIANTLSLSVHDRTSELGLLRAVGSTRAQVRSTIRGEAVIVSALGTTIGLAVGTFLGWGLMRAIAADLGMGVFSAPWGRLAMVLALGTLVGVVAAARPARTAARLDVLDAIAAE